MSSKKARQALAKYLSQHLSSFGDGLDGYLLCPTCMRNLHADDDVDKYTAGHIVPESAGGKEWTILCKTCNSDFGKLQDKWFGEYLCVLKNPEGTFFHAKTKSKYLTVNGIDVSGRIAISEKDGVIEVFLPINRNPPGKVESIPSGGELNMQFTPEITKHVNEVQVGYITAAYLKWFKIIGYNWIMQSSLEIVRKQILDCNYSLDGAKVVYLEGDKLHNPDIGVILESGHVYPCCLMFDRVVIFPSPNGSEAPSPQSISFSATKDVHFLNLEIMSLPYSVNFDGSIAVLPDMLRTVPPVPEHMLYIQADGAGDAQWLRLDK